MGVEGEGKASRGSHRRAYKVGQPAQRDRKHEHHGGVRRLLWQHERCEHGDGNAKCREDAKAPQKLVVVVKGGVLRVEVVVTGMQYLVRSRTYGVALAPIPQVVTIFCTDLILWSMAAIESRIC